MNPRKTAITLLCAYAAFTSSCAGEDSGEQLSTSDGTTGDAVLFGAVDTSPNADLVNTPISPGLPDSGSSDAAVTADTIKVDDASLPETDSQSLPSL